METPNKIEIYYKIDDPRKKFFLKKISDLGFNVSNITLIDTYTVLGSLEKDEIERVAEMLFNPVIQSYSINYHLKFDFNYSIEIGFLPGVTDNVGHTTSELIEYLLSKKAKVFTSRIFLLKGELTKEDAESIAKAFSNELIQKVRVKTRTEFFDEKEWYVPLTKMNLDTAVDSVSLDITEQELIKLGKEGIRNPDNSRRGPLALDLASLNAIKKYFSLQGRNPTDIELESLAQTWSEHCKHTIFSSELDEIEDGLYRHYIQRATNEIREELGKSDFCVSVFKDNSGGIIFDDDYVITDKVETHNSPSALDPFGGAVTGIVGVNRDTIGFGLGALPVINKYGFCVGFPDDNSSIFKDRNLNQKMLSPKRILNGIVDGVNFGGNCSGIPTPQGFVYFDKRFKGKPLVFVGTIGLIPRELNGKKSHEKTAKHGDYIVMVGGRVGADGIHGATFSSEELSSGSPATAVQIGDPITQKKFSDAIVKEARDRELFSSITDNGAGGLSCSVAEMAQESGGFVVDLEKIPLKYPGLDSWQIWISESQERMTLSIPKEKWNEFHDLMESRGCEATIIGEFNDSEKAVVKKNGEKILDLEMDFLHDGSPKKILFSEKKEHINVFPEYDMLDLNTLVLEMIGRHNCASFSFISMQYDHEVQGGSVLKPLINGVNSSASVTRPLNNRKKGVVLSQGITSRYSDISAYWMAASAIDTAVRNNVAAGGSLARMALLDNFCWCSSLEPERLFQLRQTAKACYDFAKAFKTPYISGKDSMFNDFKGFDEHGNETKISIPPTLLVSSISVIENVEDSISFDAKFEGDLIYLLGETKNELGCSEYHYYLSEKMGNDLTAKGYVPKVDGIKARKKYQRFYETNKRGLISSAISVGLGGLGIALSKMLIAGNLGAEIELSRVKTGRDLRADQILFSETQSRILLTVNPEKAKELEEMLDGLELSMIGKVQGKNLKIQSYGTEFADIPVEKLRESHESTFRGY